MENDPIQEIPANTDVEMTPTYHRLFVAGGCRPCCHLCLKNIEVGQKFKLSTVNEFETPSGSSNSGLSIATYPITSQEVMLCSKCTVEDFNDRTDKAKKAYEEHRKKGGGCYRINGKIVH